MSHKVACKSFTFMGTDGNHLTFSETAERDAIVVSIQQNDEKGRIATVRIDAAIFDELCRLDSSFDGLECKELEEIKAARERRTSQDLGEHAAEAMQEAGV